MLATGQLRRPLFVVTLSSSTARHRHLFTVTWFSTVLSSHCYMGNVRLVGTFVRFPSSILVEKVRLYRTGRDGKGENEEHDYGKVAMQDYKMSEILRNDATARPK